MTEDNDLLLKQFFQEAAQQQIPDNGFTERVMQRLNAANVQRPTFNVQRLSRLWTLFCIVVFAVLFVLIDGWELLTVQFEVLLRTMAVQTFSVNLLMVATVLFGLLFVGVGEIISSEIVRR